MQKYVLISIWRYTFHSIVKNLSVSMNESGFFKQISALLSCKIFTIELMPVTGRKKCLVHFATHNTDKPFLACFSLKDWRVLGVHMVNPYMSHILIIVMYEMSYNAEFCM